MACNDQIFGLAHSGAMDEARLLQILPALPPGVTEIYLHPATASGSAIAPAMPAIVIGMSCRHCSVRPCAPRCRTRPSGCGGYADIARSERRRGHRTS